MVSTRSRENENNINLVAPKPAALRNDIRHAKIIISYPERSSRRLFSYDPVLV
jgi:hypothetical protein